MENELSKEIVIYLCKIVLHETNVVTANGGPAYTEFFSKPELGGCIKFLRKNLPNSRFNSRRITTAMSYSQIYEALVGEDNLKILSGLGN